MTKLLLTVISLLFSVSVLAAEPSADRIDLTSTNIGFAAIVVFILAYSLVMGEEKLHMRKSKPVLVAAGVIWILIGFVYTGEKAPMAEEAFRHNLLEFAELMLFLLVAMTYINAMEERRLFDALRAWLLKGFSYRKLFWITGGLAFFYITGCRQSNYRIVDVCSDHEGCRR